MKIYKTLLFLLVAGFFSRIESLEVKEDDYYIYTIRQWVEIVGGRQKELVIHFNNLFQERIKSLEATNHWTAAVGQALLGSTPNSTRFTDLVNELQSMANSCALSQSIRFENLLPTGFLMGFGLSGSGSYVIGIGGSALLTFILVPLEIERFNKATGETTTYYEVSWSLGGIAQGQVGIGESGSFAFHGCLGLIWGDMPEASALTGPGIGMTASISQVAGLGVKAAFVLNTTTNHYNLVAMVTYDVGLQTGATLNGAVYYFMGMDQVLKSLNIPTTLPLAGKDTVMATSLQNLIPGLTGPTQSIAGVTGLKM